MVFLTIVAIFFLLPLIVLAFSKWRYSYWKRRGVEQLNPEFGYGDLREMLTGQIPMGEHFMKLYMEFKNRKAKYAGVYWVFKPQFLAMDLQLVKNILKKDFMYFNGRGLYHHEKDVLSHHLFRMEGESWKKLRTKLTPTFTSGKVKMMFETLCEKNTGLTAMVDKHVKDGGRLNVKEAAALFTTDVIGSCAFGIECDSLKEPNCEFRSYCKQVSIPRHMRDWLEAVVPWKLLGYAGYRIFPEVEDFFKKIVKDTINYRIENNIYRKDFMHLLIQLRNRGVLTDDGNITKVSKEAGILTDDEITAQCFLFFAAGFDTASATMAFALYELALNPDIQDKLRQEIRDVLKKCGGKLTYEATKDLTYTEKVIKESLRKYPVVPLLPRLCTRTYKVPDSDLVIQKGTEIQVSIRGIHMDPEYYPNPEIFDPERFSQENIAKRPDCSYLPFGDGPKQCIALTFGMVQAKVGLVGLVKDFSYSLAKDTPRPLLFEKGIFLMHAKGDLYLNVSRVPE